MKGLPRKGMCQCGHLRWKDHRRTYDGKECYEMDCKKCDCKGYKPQISKEVKEK